MATAEDREVLLVEPIASRVLCPPMGDDQKIPKGRVRRSAKLGTVLGGQATKYAGTQGGERRALEGGGRGEARGTAPRDRDEDGRRPRAR